MRNGWVIEEEIIEWVGSERSFARETLLINPQGTIVARRLANTITRTEICLFVHGDRCFRWHSSDPRQVVYARLSAEVQSSLMGRFVLYHGLDRSLIFLGQRARWKLLKDANHREYPSITEPASVRKYQLDPPFGKARTVEWRLFSPFPPQPTGVIAELWVDNDLYRRHLLLQSREATMQEVEMFKVPRGASPRPVAVEAVMFFPIGGYEVVVPEEMGK